MRVFYSPYQLESRWQKGHFRDGALLKVVFEDNLIGYADCHPWESLGDAPLAKQIHLLSKSQSTPLTKQSIHFARLDAKARAENRNLFDRLSIPKSHILIPRISDWKNVFLPEGTTHLKVKLGAHIQEEIPLLKNLAQKYPTMVIRLDFNNQLKPQEFLTFLRLTAQMHNQIDFIEDPFSYDPVSWGQIQSDWRVRLAKDRGCRTSPKAPFFRIVKPAVDALESYQMMRDQFLVTSYLDHPLGQLAAAYIAARHTPKQVCGLLSHLVYETNPFSEELHINQTVLVPPSGTGFGFDLQLETCAWKPV